MIQALVTGFLTTLKHVFRRAVTIQYPEERREPAARFRGLHALRRYPETGEERCISCCLCARICPTQCIRLVTSGEEKRVIDEYDVDLGHCLLCGLCAEVCPEEAVVLSPAYDAVANLCAHVVGAEHVRRWRFRAERHWSLRIEDLERLISPRTKLLRQVWKTSR